MKAPVAVMPRLARPAHPIPCLFFPPLLQRVVPSLEGRVQRVVPSLGGATVVRVAGFPAWAGVGESAARFHDSQLSGEGWDGRTGPPYSIRGFGLGEAILFSPTDPRSQLEQDRNVVRPGQGQ